MRIKTDGRPQVVIVGAGFAGLHAAQALAGAAANVLVVDRNNYHCFIPLLYQVATAGLEPEEIAQPIRRILRAQNIQFPMAGVRHIDVKRRWLTSDRAEIAYDYLVLAAGSIPSFFGLEAIREIVYPLRDLGDAIQLRNQVLRTFERAEVAVPKSRAHLMTIAIVGGGPTGVEVAGALAELKRHVLPSDFPRLDLREARVVLLEATDTILPTFPPRLRVAARRQLESLGVEVRLNAAVARAERDRIILSGGEVVPAGTIVWVAGMRAPWLTATLGFAQGPNGRARVTDTLQVPGHPEVYAVGDMAYVESQRGHSQVAPVAIQQGTLAGANIRRALANQRPKGFRYRDRGMLVTVGRSAAVGTVSGVELTGRVAWLAWLLVHIIQLIGLRNRLLVLVNWAWNYFTYERGVRIITESLNERPLHSE